MTKPKFPPPPPRAGSYRVIYADPPWRFSTWSEKGKGRSPEAWYDCLDLAAIRNLPVGSWAARDAVLLLWVTDPMLERAFEVIRAWGFSYRTVGFVWVKLHRGRSPELIRPGDWFTGLGYWTRANPELCLLAARGSVRRRARDVPRLVVTPRREHSRKPDEIYERIERLLEGPYLELFARNLRPGWDPWGLETDAFESGGPRRRWKSDGAPVDGSAPDRKAENADQRDPNVLENGVSRTMCASEGDGEREDRLPAKEKRK